MLSYEVPILLDGNEEATVTGIQGVGESTTVRTDDGRVVPINEVDFGDFEIQSLYEIAGEFPDNFTANRFLQIYRDSRVEVPEFLQVYLDEYVKDMQGRTDATEDDPNSLPETPFDVKDVAPYGTLDFSDESLDTIKALFEQEGLPLPEGLESVHPDEDVAPSDKSDIMESPDAKEEGGSGTDDTGDRSYRAIEIAGETVTYRRVQGGDGTNSTRQRISVNADGSISIVNKESNLSISIDNGEHSAYFRDNVRGRENT